MNFQIKEKTLEGLELIEIQNQISGAYVNIIPGYGGAINEVVLNHKGKLHSIHKFAKSLQEFQEVSIPLFAGAFLAPFPNRIKNAPMPIISRVSSISVKPNVADAKKYRHISKAPDILTYKPSIKVIPTTACTNKRICPIPPSTKRFGANIKPKYE